MNDRIVRILYVDDYPMDRALVREELHCDKGAFELVEAASRQEFDTLLRAKNYDLVLSDFNILGFTGFQVLDAVQERMPGTPVIIVTGTGSEEVAVEAIKRGAADYVIKTPSQIRRLPHLIKTILETQRLRIEQKKAEASLREYQQLMVKTFASLHDAVFIIDADTVEIISCNQAASEIFGYDLDEMIGRTTTFLHIDEAALEEFRGYLYSSIQEKGFLGHLEFRMRRRDGTVFPTEHSVAVLEDEQGQRIGWVSVVRDITKRKLAEEQERELRIIAEALRDTALALSGPLEIDQVFDRILENVWRVVPGESINLMLVEGECVTIVRQIGHEKSGWKAGTQLIWKLSECSYLKRMAATRKPLLIRNTRKSPYWNEVVGGEWIRSYIGAPIVSEDKEVIGIMSMGHSKARFFAPHHVERLSSFAGQVAIALRNAQTQQALRRRGEELQRLTIRLAEAEENERRRLARELHDGVGQSLAVLGLNLGDIREQIEQAGLDAGLSLADRSLALVEEVIQNIRDVMDDLRPPMLDDEGLFSTLSWCCDRFSERTGIEMLVLGKDLEPRPAGNVENTLFRIAQEALTNVTRHARASRVTISLEEEREEIELAIEDNGSGFDDTAPRSTGQRHGWGLVNMRERAEAIGGTLTIETTLDQGTTIRVRVPRG